MGLLRTPCLMRKRASLGNDAYTKFLCNFEGADGGTSATDLSASAHSISFEDTAELSDTKAKFGNTSVYFTGTIDDCVAMPDSGDWTFANQEFTIDFWIYPTILPEYNTYDYLCGQRAYPADGFFFFSIVNASNVYYFDFIYDDDDTVDVRFTSGPITITQDSVWHHVAIIRGWGGNGNKYKVCYDGVGLAAPFGNDENSSTLPNLANEFCFGGIKGHGGGSIKGYIDAARVSKNIARWTSDFTPPTRQWR